MNWDKNDSFGLRRLRGSRHRLFMWVLLFLEMWMNATQSRIVAAVSMNKGRREEGMPVRRIMKMHEGFQVS